MPDVSRETPGTEGPPPPPEVAREVFPGDRMPMLERYAALLASEGVVRGLIGPREAPRLWDRHLVNCGLLGPLVPESATVADLGSGAGLPGLVLALARPDLHVTLVEPLLRRTTFLEEAVRALELSNVEVLRGRAEQLPDTRRFDVVTARALAPLTRLLGWGLPLVARGGVLLAMKGSSAEDEIAEAASELRSWRATAKVLELSVAGSSTARVVRVAAADDAGIGWPSRSTGPRATKPVPGTEPPPTRRRRAPRRPRRDAR